MGSPPFVFCKAALSGSKAWIDPLPACTTVLPAGLGFALLAKVAPSFSSPSLAVTLGYLRGLEIPSLRLEDMPRL